MRKTLERALNSCKERGGPVGRRREQEVGVGRGGGVGGQQAKMAPKKFLE